MNQRGSVIVNQVRRDISDHFSRSRTMAPKKQVEDAPASGGGVPGKQYRRDPTWKTRKEIKEIEQQHCRQAVLSIGTTENKVALTQEYCRDPTGKTVVETHTKSSYADGDNGSGRASEQQLMVAKDAHKPWPPVAEELELHDMAVPCPVCKQDTTACGGYFQWGILREQWKCTQRVYVHASSCCTSEPA